MDILQRFLVYIFFILVLFEFKTRKRRLNWIFYSCFIAFSVFGNLAFSEEITPEEALFVRRILEFWKDKETHIVKSQINQFIETYPKSAYIDSLLVILGDTLWNEKQYMDSLQAYNAISSNPFQQKVLNNRLDCLYRLERYEELTMELKPKLEPLDLNALNPEQALWVYYQAEALLQTAKQTGDPALSRGSYEQTSYLFKKLLPSVHAENARLALIEIELALGNQENAVNYYLDLARDIPEKKGEMLLEAAQLQSAYDPREALRLLEEVQHNHQGQLSSQAALKKLVLLYDEGCYQQIVDGRKEIENLLNTTQKPILDFYLGRSYFALKQYDQAVSYLRPLLKEENHLPSRDASVNKTILLTIAASAQHLNDLILIQNIAKEFETDYPHDPAYAKILYLKGLTHQHSHQLKEALADFERIEKEYQKFERMENVLFEISLLHYKTEEWENSRAAFLKLIEQAPESTQGLAARQYLPCISLQMLEKAEAKGEAAERLREQLLSDLKQAMETPGVIKPAQKPIYMLKIGKLYYDMQRYNEAMDVLNQYLQQHVHDENLFQGHLLMAMCYHEDKQDLSMFTLHAEKTLDAKPEFSDQCRLRLNLFSAYLQRAKALKEQGREEIAYQDCIDKAVEHLHKVYKLKPEQIKAENKLWMADYFYNKVKGNGNDYIIEPLASHEALELAREAAGIYKSALGWPENGAPITDQTLYLEHELFKLSNLYGWLNSIDAQVKILDTLIGLQQKNPAWEWSLRTRTLFSKANAMNAQGNLAAALNAYSSLMNNHKSTDLFITNATKLQWARLYFASLPQERRTTEDPEMLSVLNTLKNLQIRKSIAHEPIHVEAALEYAVIRASLEPEERQPQQMQFLLSRIKEDFTTKDDVRSKDYHAGRQQNPAKDLVYQAYMMLIDAHLARMEAQQDDGKGDILEKQAKLEAAQEIYGNLLTGRYAVSKYLVNEAKTGHELIQKLEKSYDPSQ